MYGIDSGMGGKMRSIATMKAKKKKNSKMGKAYNKMETSKDYKPLPFLDGPKRKAVKGGPSDVESYMKKGGKTKDGKKKAGITTLEMKPRMRKKSNLKFKPSGR
jgi:hypothetical protein